LEDAEVRQRVRQLLVSRRIPGDDPHKLWAGPSMGKPCTACGELIRTTTEYELDFAGTITVLLHPRCYAIWNEERKRARPASSAGQAS
jgi:hypothetical protein